MGTFIIRNRTGLYQILLHASHFFQFCSRMVLRLRFFTQINSNHPNPLETRSFKLRHHLGKLALRKVSMYFPFPMFDQLVLSEISFLAPFDRASVRPLANMPSLMVISVPVHRKLFWAKSASEGLLLGMDSGMHLPKQ